MACCTTRCDLPAPTGASLYAGWLTATVHKDLDEAHIRDKAQSREVPRAPAKPQVPYTALHEYLRYLQHVVAALGKPMTCLSKSRPQRTFTTRTCPWLKLRGVSTRPISRGHSHDVELMYDATSHPARRLRIGDRRKAPHLALSVNQKKLLTTQPAHTNDTPCAHTLFTEQVT